MPNGDYPVQFSVDYPDRPLNRLTTGFRIFAAIPILIVLATIGGGTASYGRPRLIAGRRRAARSCRRC